MALVTIGSTVLPSPSELSLGVQDIVKADRNAKGNMIIERVAVKQKLSLSWAYLSAADMSTVLTALSPMVFSITYTDPITNALRQPTQFYVGDRNMGVLDFRGGVPRYKDVKFDLIEI